MRLLMQGGPVILQAEGVRAIPFEGVIPGDPATQLMSNHVNPDMN